TYKTLKYEGLDSLTNEINNLIVCENIGKVLLGLPLSVAGFDTQKTAEIREVFSYLQNRIEAPLLLWDERYSTSDAKNILISKGMTLKNSKKVIDQTAAALILRSYLESNDNA
ncbi:MAG: Holliday junction resolvase RuvX, partial [Candidatus Cloacimonadales bacterium]|nr:Holliday junction resolvase RuvX [Candidatus Cloacimonadales bacterium]